MHALIFINHPQNQLNSGKIPTEFDARLQI